MTFFKIGLFTFGGGLAMISVASREVVENKKWITEDEMADIVVVAESTPGAFAVNAATYVGYKVGGFLGSLFATLGVCVPPLVIISVIFFFFDRFKENVWIAAAFKGIRAAVITLLFTAFLKLLRPMEKTPVTIAVAVVSFAVTLFTGVNSIYLILSGGLIGAVVFAVLARRARSRLAAEPLGAQPSSGGEESPAGRSAGGETQASAADEASAATASGTSADVPESNAGTPAESASETLSKKPPENQEVPENAQKPADLPETPTAEKPRSQGGEGGEE